MEILPLEFVSPKVLNELGNAQMLDSSIWILHETNEKLELDTESWTIRSGETQGIIDQWEANQNTNEMRLKSEFWEEDFEPIDFTFAVSMIGQIGNKQHLQNYLASLQRIFLIEYREEIRITPIKNNTQNIENHE